MAITLKQLRELQWAKTNNPSSLLDPTTTTFKNFYNTGWVARANLPPTISLSDTTNYVLDKKINFAVEQIVGFLEANGVNVNNTDIDKIKNDLINNAMTTLINNSTTTIINNIKKDGAFIPKTDVVNVHGTSTTKVPSQNLLNGVKTTADNALSAANANKTTVVQVKGASTTSVLSQNAVNNLYVAKSDIVSTFGTSKVLGASQDLANQTKAIADSIDVDIKRLQNKITELENS